MELNGQKSVVSAVQSLCSQEEMDFFQVLKTGDTEAVKDFLKTHHKLDVNCQNIRSQTAMEFCVQTKEGPMLHLFLEMEEVSVSHLRRALLKVIEDNHRDFFEDVLLGYEKKCSKKESPPDSKVEVLGSIPTRVCREVDGWTPLTAAAICNNVEMLYLLLQRGYKLDRPHHTKCRCEVCLESQKNTETLSASIRRISSYRVLANPAYLLLTSRDPVLSAFQLYRELRCLAKKRPEHDETYNGLARQCSELATRLLDLCRETSEVETLLAQRPGNKDPRNRRFPRLQMALWYQQKEFVVHPSCQQVLRSLWSEGLPEWWNLSNWNSFGHTLMHALLTPFLFLVLFLPFKSIQRTVQVPIHRFIYSATSYLIFLMFIFYTLIIETRGADVSFSFKDVLLLFLIVGYFWDILTNVYLLGFRICWKDYWIRYDMIMFTTFTLAHGFLLMLYLMTQFNANVREMQLLYLQGLDAMFAAASIMSIFRIIYWYQNHPKLGPLERSIQLMITDLLLFTTVIALCVFSFAVGLTFLYGRTSDIDHNKISEHLPRGLGPEFTTVSGSIHSLFWAMFGKTDLKLTALASTEFRNLTGNRNYDIKSAMGYAIFSIYNVITVIVLLNMLVAMLSDSFQRVKNNAATEWKFCRSRVWLSYLERRSTLAPPFNLLPSLLGMAATISSMLEWSRKKNVEGWIDKEKNDKKKCFSWTTEEDGEAEKRLEKAYEALVLKLIQRYFQCTRNETHPS